jgi:pimeloyl-ACP methyl ester carboxylesterase
MNKLASGAFETRTIKVAGIDVELWRSGAGQPLVFLHPGDGLEQSIGIVQKLSTRYDVIAASHPGFGATGRPAGITTVDDLSYFYLDFFSELKLREVIVVGVSFGAWIAAEIATKCTGVLSRLVLADALGVKFADRTTREIADLFSVPQYEQARLLYRDGQKQNFSDWPEEQLLRLARIQNSGSVCIASTSLPWCCGVRRTRWFQPNTGSFSPMPFRAPNSKFCKAPGIMRISKPLTVSWLPSTGLPKARPKR